MFFSIGQYSHSTENLAPIEVAITTHLGDQQTFVEGDVISFLLSLDHQAYVYLYYEDADKKIFQIFPNQRSGKHLYNKGLFMPVPPSQSNFQLVIQPPFGEEKVLVIATDNANVKLDGRVLDNGLQLVEEDIRGLESRIRQQSSKQFGSASMTITSRYR